MVRPCFIVLDREYPGSISTRKLVIETAKLNVLTVYSAGEALETLKAFPAAHGVVMDSEVHGMPGEELVLALKKIKSDLPVVAICGSGQDYCPSADYELRRFDPNSLVELLGSLMPKETVALEKHEKDLNLAR